MARLQPGSGKGEKVRVFVDSAALCEDVPSTYLHRYIHQRAAELTKTSVRAHQQPGDRLARQTPPGARPNMDEARAQNPAYRLAWQSFS